MGRVEGSSCKMSTTPTEDQTTMTSGTTTPRVSTDATSLKNRFGKPWKESDVTLVVEDEEFHVHHSILMHTSPVLYAMFSQVILTLNCHWSFGIHGSLLSVRLFSPW